MMHETIQGVRDGTRSLEMEVLCSLPPQETRVMWQNRAHWTQGALLLSLAQDFGVSMPTIRETLTSLRAAGYAVQSGHLAPCKLGNGPILPGGQCAFIAKKGKEHAKNAAETYWGAHENKQ
jgi:hypothetical protein